MKRPIILGVLGLLVAASILLGAAMNSRFTECYGNFESEKEADAAAELARDAGHDAEVERTDRDFAVIFESGETGDDARDFRETFQDAVEQQDGELGHPDDGCLERTSFN